ncbi:MAG: amidohydrolase family protein [Nitrospinae bacterium]|nr:amidohydrolase family protein [Nitrospinota bacterium]
MPGPADKKYFIDTHCHLFNIDHIPLYAFLDRINLNLGKWGALFLNLNKALDENKKFMEFFESEPEKNIENLVSEINQIAGVGDLQDRCKILTPLAMDFELADNCRHETLSNQVSRLLGSIKNSKGILDQYNFKVLPFLGLDLRRFDGIDENGIENHLKRLISDYAGSIKDADGRHDPANLESGDIIGIKLYPPIGFNPYPENEATRRKYLAVYRTIIQLDLPVTVHCQKVSYNLVDKKKKEQFTTPINWERVLKEQDLKDLRINLAHFGGEEGIKATLWDDESLWGDDFFGGINFDRVNQNNWTFAIIKLLKSYKNTYSDISAFDYKDREAVFALGWLLSLDHAGEFNSLGSFKLKDKLLWGSDRPMILPQFSSYKEYFDGFLKAIDISQMNFGSFNTPKKKYGEAKIPVQNDLLESFININPMKFLFK